MQGNETFSAIAEDHGMENLQHETKEEFESPITEFKKARTKRKRSSEISDQKLHFCEHCDFTTTQHCYLKSHSQKHFSDLLQCQHCDYTTNQPRNLKRHNLKHSGEVLQCEHCDYTTTRRPLLKTHNLKHSGEVFQCEHCDYTTHRYHNLKLHKLKHTREKEYIEIFRCLHCDFTTSRPDFAVEHAKTHNLYQTKRIILQEQANSS